MTTYPVTEGPLVRPKRLRLRPEAEAVLRLAALVSISWLCWLELAETLTPWRAAGAMACCWGFVLLSYLTGRAEEREQPHGGKEGRA